MASWQERLNDLTLQDVDNDSEEDRIKHMTQTEAIIATEYFRSSIIKGARQGKEPLELLMLACKGLSIATRDTVFLTQMEQIMKDRV